MAYKKVAYVFILYADSCRREYDEIQKMREMRFNRRDH